MATTVSLDTYALVTTTEAEDFVWKLNHDRTDEEKDVLYRIINGISLAIKKSPHYKPIINEEFTQFFDGGNEEIYLPHYPIVSITSVTDNGSVLDDPSSEGAGDGDYGYYADMGLIYRESGEFYDDRQSVKVVWTAGYASDTASVPWDVKQGVLIWIKQMMEADVENYATIIEGDRTVRPSQMPVQTRKFLEPYQKVSMR